MDIERPETPVGLSLTLAVVGGVVALLVVRWLFGIVTAVIQLGMFVAVIAAVALVISRLTSKR